MTPINTMDFHIFLPHTRTQSAAFICFEKEKPVWRLFHPSFVAPALFRVLLFMS